MTGRPMPPQDSLWLFLDRPTNLLTITSVLWTADPVDPQRLRAVLQERLLDRYPVFRQRPVLGGTLLRSGRWEDDPGFDLDRHLVVAEMPAPGTKEALQDYVAAQRSAPLDREHPLWSVHLLQGYGRGSAVVQRYHHAMADGIRLTQVMLGILDPVGDGRRAPVGNRNGFHHGSVHLAGQAAAAVRAVGGGPVLDMARAVTAVLPPVVRPDRLIDATASTGAALLNSAASVLKILGWSNPPSALTGRPGVPKTAAWGEPVPLELLSAIGHATGTTVNDVCLTLVAGAVARHLAEVRPDGGRVDDLGWLVPVNLEPFDAQLPPELGNHFALVLAVLPHRTGDFRQRLAEVHRRVGRIRDSYEPLLTYSTQHGIARSPGPLAARLSRFFTEKAVGVLTNVPGPRVPMELAGARVDGVVGWAPCSGRQAVTVCIFSYAGQVTVGFGTDRAVLPEPERLVAAFDAELAAARAAMTEATESAAATAAPNGRSSS